MSGAEDALFSLIYGLVGLVVVLIVWGMIRSRPKDPRK
jgi:uncharacterized membrane protein YeaQ/YmgE (transglycosylase-associated protein family)